MIIQEHTASTEASAKMQKSVHMETAAVQFDTLSSVRSAASAEYAFESSTATSMSESVISMSSSSYGLELSGCIEAMSSGVLVHGAKRGETH